jgi:hypothetical protein
MGFQKGNSNGVSVGKSHKEGGIPMKNKSTNQMIELEGGEGVINKRNMASKKTYEFEGEEKTICEIASDINSADGNGVSIDCDDITGKQYKYNKGGMVDLFEEYEQQPIEVRAIYDKYQDKIIDGDFDYSDSAEFLKEMQSIGYTFEYGLDNEPYGLRPIGVSLNQLEGYEEYAKGGDIKRGIFKGYEQTKRGVLIPLQKAPIGFGVQETPKASVLIGLEFNKYDITLTNVDFDIVLIKGMVCALITQKGKRRLKVNIEKGNYTLDDVIFQLKKVTANYFNTYAKGGKVGTKFIVEKKGDRHFNKIGVAEYGIQKDSKGVDYITLFFDKGVSTYSMEDVQEIFEDGGKLEPTIEELKERERKSQEDFNRLWSGFKRNVADAFSGYERPSSQETNSYIEEYNKQKHNKRANRKFKMGGMNYDPHNVYVEFDNKFDADIYTMSGRYDGETSFKPKKMYKMVFLNNQGNKSALQFPLTDSYVLIPNSEFTITGFEERYAKGGSINPYQKYSLSENDKRIIEMLRRGSESGLNLSIGQLNTILSFKGDNVANQLTNDIISKVYGLMYKNHNIDNPIKTLLIKNVGVGKLYNQAPITLDKIYITHSDNTFGTIEEEIFNLNNFNEFGIKGKLEYFTNIGLSNINAIVCCCEHTDPKTELLISDLEKTKNNAIGVCIAEFSSKDRCVSFIEENIKGAINRSKTQYTTINKGITNKGVITLIYTITKI